jgi:hypothetical protein
MLRKLVISPELAYGDEALTFYIHVVMVIQARK